MALPATDTFTAANGTLLSTYNASWTDLQGSHDIIENAACPNQAGTHNLVYWNADAFEGDHYSEADVARIYTDLDVVHSGVAVRIQSGPLAYVFTVNIHKARLAKVSSGSISILDDTYPIPSTGTRIRLEVAGTSPAVLSVYYDDVLQGTYEDNSSPITGGAAGLYGLGNSGNTGMDNWEGGNVSAGSPAVGEGTLSAGDSTIAGTGERVVTGTGAAQAQPATSAATGERAVTGTGALLVQSSAVSGSGGLQLKLVLTQATSRNLVDESGAPVANLADIAYEWYDALDNTDGNPTQKGTFSTNENGEATIQLPSSALTSGQSGTLILYHPTDSAIRGVYRIPVT